MVWLRMLWVAVRLAWPDLLAPWRSPLLRWRLETYGVVDAAGRPLHAGQIGAGTFLKFCLLRRLALARFLRWAALL